MIPEISRIDHEKFDEIITIDNIDIYAKHDPSGTGFWCNDEPLTIEDFRSNDIDIPEELFHNVKEWYDNFYNNCPRGNIKWMDYKYWNIHGLLLAKNVKLAVNVPVTYYDDFLCESVAIQLA